MRPKRATSGFTLIELLTVIAIIMLIMGLALPNFIEIMRNRRWTEALGTVQNMITRARALATGYRNDMSVEFDVQGDNGTRMWLESEVILIETMPDFSTYVANQVAGSRSSTPYYVFLVSVWAASGGASNGSFNAANTKTVYAYGNMIYYGDNARQSEVVWLGSRMTLDRTGGFSPNFESWDAPRIGCPYGKDGYPDVRIGPHGALVPSIEPTICFKEIGANQRRQYQVVRCTGRLVAVH
jgi:prepilin-type N-terminal cleavage/methylation domain-containing protein